MEDPCWGKHLSQFVSKLVEKPTFQTRSVLAKTIKTTSSADGPLGYCCKSIKSLKFIFKFGN